VTARRKLDPRTCILDAAEQVFADAGFEGASLRQIVRQAQVNLATVYYYFRSKEGLLAAVFKRRFDPIKQEQLDRLRQAEQAARGRPLRVSAILEIMLHPPLSLATQPSTATVAQRLIGRIVTEPHPQAQDLVFSQFGEVRRALFQALRRSLPKLAPADLHWRIEFFWGALTFVLCNPGKIEKMSEGVCNPADMPAVQAQMLAFFVPAMRAPGAIGPRTDRMSHENPEP
jgi:AcrR family transcriptional regulator